MNTLLNHNHRKIYLLIAVYLLLSCNLQAQLKAIFTVDTISGCAPFKVNINESSTGEPTQYFWDFGNGQTSNLRSPVVTYTTPGVYTLTETVTSGNEQSSTFTTIYVRGVSPTFTYTYADICTTPADISFVADSIDFTTKYHWEFGNDNKSIDATPVNTYTKAGTYQVQLITINPQGCQDTSTQNIQVGKGDAGFLLPPIACVGQPVLLSNNSSPIPKTTVWKLDNTTLSGTNATYTFNKAGNYTVQMDADFGTCKQSLSKQINVLASPRAAFNQFGILQSCTYPADVSFINNSADAIAYKWLFGDGATAATQQAAHTYSTAGLFDVSLIAFNANGCTDTFTKPALVQLGPPVISGFNNLPISGCVPVTAYPTANIISSEAIISYDWDFGDGQHDTAAAPAHVYTAAGYYRVTLTVKTASGCSGTYSMFQAVAGGAFPPTVDFSVPDTSICGNAPVQFSASATGTVTSWNWDFGDGSKSSLQNPVFRYNSIGNFTVTLYVSDKGCNANVQKKNFLLVKPPISKIQPVYYCDDRLKVDFIDQSIQPMTWQWDFGDGTSSSSQNETHRYKKSGEYHVSLTTTNNGCTSVVDTLITVVSDKPKLAITPAGSELCRGDSVTISTDDASYIVDYLWNFGDGTTIFDNSSMQYAYKKNGVFDPSLIVSYVNGCKDTSTLPKSIRVYGPTAAFDFPATACLEEAVPFTDRSQTDGLHAIKTWQWSGGDGEIVQQNAAAFSHRYTTGGIYTPTVKVTDAFGCTDSVAPATPLNIKGAVAAFNYTTPGSSCDSALYNFTDQSNQSNDVITQYKWDFGDGDKASSKDPQHYYTQSADSMQVLLTVVTAGGCADTAAKAIAVTIAKKPEVIINVPEVTCMREPVSFTATQTGETDVTGWVWDFGNGTTGNEQNTTYTYNAPATYEVKLIAINNAACADTATQLITVKPLPAVNAGEDMFICSGKAANLSAVGAETYIWLPAVDLSCLDCAAPVASPVNTTKYYVRGTDNNGCANEDSILVTVQQPNQLSVDKNNINLCKGDSIILSATGSDVYLWEPANGLNNPAIANPVAKPLNTTTYTVTATDKYHCFTATKQVNIVVSNKPVFNISDSLLMLNKGDKQQLQTSSSADVVNWLWQPQQGLNCYNCANPLLTADQPITYTATATTASSCSATDKIRIEILCDNTKLYIPTAFTPNGDGKNDRFYPLSATGASQKVKSFNIYNSSGQKMFSKQNIYTNSYADGWDGSYKSYSSGENVFVYKIEVECNGRIIPFTGTVTVIR